MLAYNRLIDGLRESDLRVLHSRILSPGHIDRTARIGLLIADAVVLYCAGDDNKTMYVHLFKAHERGLVSPGVALFSDETLSKWGKQTRIFAERGRLVCLPVPVVMRRRKAKKKVADLEFADCVSTISDWESVALAATSNSEALLQPRGFTSVGSHRIDVLSMAMPFIDGIEFDTLAKVLDDEEPSLVIFRKQINTVIEELRKWHGTRMIHFS